MESNTSEDVVSNATNANDSNDSDRHHSSPNAPRILNLLTDHSHEEYVVGLHGQSLNLFVATELNQTTSQSLEFSFDKQLLPLAGRTITRHPTRPSYYIITGKVHRAALAAKPSHSQRALPSLSFRSLTKPNHYVSNIQLYHAETRRLLPPYSFAPGEAIQTITVGSFRADFGKEPVVIVSAAPRYSHGAYLAKPASFSQGWLHTFRFETSTLMPLRQPRNQSHSTENMMRNTTSSSSSTTSTSATLGGMNTALKLKPVHSTLLRPYPVDSNTMNTSVTHGQGVELAEEMNDYASALHICEPVGLLFVGLGARNGLWVYTWGMKHLLRKRHLPNAPSRITAIDTVFITPPWYTMVAHSTSSSSSSSASAPTTSSPFYAADIYRCRMDDSNSMQLARDKQLLIICATVNHSVFVATLLPGSSTNSSSTGNNNLPSYLMYIAHDNLISRSVTCMTVLDERTIAVGDRFGSVAILRIPFNTRFSLSEKPEALRDAEVHAMTEYFNNEQFLEEVALYQTGSVVTSLSSLRYDPSHGEDAQLQGIILFYATTRGSIGALLPFISEEDASLAAHIQPIIASHVKCSLLPYNGAVSMFTIGSTGLSLHSLGNNRLHDAYPVHHVIEGDLLRLFLQSYSDESSNTGIYDDSNDKNDNEDESANDGVSSGNSGTNKLQICMLFSNSARAAVERELTRVKKIEAARRKVLNAPLRELPSVSELVAKMRALVTLPLE